MSINGLGNAAQFSSMKCLGNIGAKGIEKNVADMVSATVSAVVGHAVLSAFEQAFSQLGGQAGGVLNGQHPFCGTPDQANSTHPSGSLKADSQNGVITTPGGYKIEMTKATEWKITTPEGKSTRIWGDPHVAEGDGGKWDFKRDSTFMLPDGTRINVSCTPPNKNGYTVTKGLEIINGNDRVQVSDINTGKGKVGNVTPDGFANVNKFGNKDVFVMSGDGDDWTFQGKEITGSKNQGADFITGKEMQPLVDNTNKFGGPEQWANQLAEQLTKQLEQLFKLPQQQELPPPFVPPWAGGSYDPGSASQGLGRAFKDLGRMFNSLGNLFQLTESLNRRMMPYSV